MSLRADDRPRLLRGAPFFAAAWTVLGAFLSSGTVARATQSGRALLLVCAVVGVLSAFTSAMLLFSGRHSLGGMLLVVSGITPTVFFWVPNVAAVVVGLVLVTRRPKRHR